MYPGIRIELLKRDDASDKNVYCAVGIGGGMINREYTVGDEVFTSNYAFGNLILNYIKIYCTEFDLEIQLLRSCEVVSFKGTQEQFGATLKKIFTLLFSNEYQKDIFEQAKAHCLNTFETNYKNARFRALIKAYEFSDLHKKFSMTKYIDDLKVIDFSKFVSCAKSLIVPSNICIYVMCNDLDSMADRVKTISSFKNEKDITISATSYDYDPFLRQDAHISNLARENATVIIEALEFLNKSATPFAKYLVLDMLSGLLGEKSVMVYADSFDASIIIETDRVSSFKHAINKGLKKEEYEGVKTQVQNNYILHLKNEPLELMIRSVEMAFSGVYIDQYLNFLSQCTFEQFEEIIENCNYFVTEAQIALRKESRNV